MRYCEGVVGNTDYFFKLIKMYTMDNLKNIKKIANISKVLEVGNLTINDIAILAEVVQKNIIQAEESSVELDTIDVVTVQSEVPSCYTCKYNDTKHKHRDLTPLFDYLKQYRHILEEEPCDFYIKEVL